MTPGGIIVEGKNAPADRQNAVGFACVLAGGELPVRDPTEVQILTISEDLIGNQAFPKSLVRQYFGYKCPFLLRG
jgi:hypothetical protein